MRNKPRTWSSIVAYAGIVVGCVGVLEGCGGTSPSSTNPPDEGGVAFTFSPSNVSAASIAAQQGSAADENLSSACEIRTDATAPEDDCFTSPIVAATQEDGSTVNLVVMQSLQVQSTGAITVSGGVPVVLVSLSNIAFLGGSIQAGSRSLDLGPGGAAGAGSNAMGGGAGGGVAASSTAAVGASGGSYCGVGGVGGGATASGAVYGSASIRPLVGGSSGGGGAVGGGAGGGGVQLTAALTLTLNTGSYISVGGQGGPFGGIAADQNAGAGGSGGSILLEAPTVTVAGTLAANGGGGGGDYSTNGGADATPNATPAAGGAAGNSEGAGGAGGAAALTAGAPGMTGTGLNAGAGGGGVGRILINSTTGGATLTSATMSPDLTTSCATQGTLRTLAEGP
jgi:hypothetical protein